MGLGDFRYNFLLFRLSHSFHSFSFRLSGLSTQATSSMSYPGVSKFSLKSEGKRRPRLRCMCSLKSPKSHPFGQVLLTQWDASSSQMSSLFWAGSKSLSKGTRSYLKKKLRISIRQHSLFPIYFLLYQVEPFLNLLTIPMQIMARIGTNDTTYRATKITTSAFRLELGSSHSISFFSFSTRSKNVSS